MENIELMGTGIEVESFATGFCGKLVTYSPLPLLHQGHKVACPYFYCLPT